MVKNRWNRNGSEHRLVTRNVGENRGWLYSPELLQRWKWKRKYLTQCSRPMGHIMWDQQIIGEANATEDGSKCQRQRCKLR